MSTLRKSAMARERHVDAASRPKGLWVWRSLSGGIVSTGTRPLGLCLIGFVEEICGLEQLLKHSASPSVKRRAIKQPCTGGLSQGRLWVNARRYLGHGLPCECGKNCLFFPPLLHQCIFMWEIFCNKMMVDFKKRLLLKNFCCSCLFSS